jgi:hypothetical protein
MSAPAAIQGDYTDLRFVKGRKVIQVVIELPIEAGEAFVKAFGTPNPATGTPVALARIVPESERKKESAVVERPGRRWNELSRAQQAGIACNEKGFWTFLYEKGWNVSEADHAAEAVRTICAVDTRSRLDVETSGAGKVWDKLYSEYQTWLRAPEVVG